jgi:hypothetical protein
MGTTIYASFNDVELAEKAAGALFDHGVTKEDLTIVANGGLRETATDNATAPIPNSVIGYATPPGGQSFGTTPVYPIDYTPTGLGNEFAAGGSTSFERTEVSAYDAAQTWPYSNESTLDADASVDSAEAESKAKTGITTTTADDAGAGAIKGTGIGLGLGILAGLATLVVPGFGLVLGGGALAAGIAAAASTTVAGAAVGGVVGYLKDQGVSEVAATNYQQAIGSGGAILAVDIPSNGIGLQEVESVLNKYGAVDISAY